MGLARLLLSVHGLKTSREQILGPLGSPLLSGAGGRTGA